MATKKKTEIAVVEEAPVVAAAVMPDFMANKAGGTENLGQEDIELAWMKLLQGTTPGLNENGWQTGSFLHSIMEEQVKGQDYNDDNGQMQEGGFSFTPLIALTPRFMLFRDLDEGGGILARAEDGVHWSPANHEFEVKINKGSKTVKWRTADTVAKSGLANWGTYDPSDPNSFPAATKQYRYVCVSPDYPEFGVFMILLQKSGVAAAKRLNAYLTNAQCPSYGLVFQAKSEWSDDGPNNKKFVWKFTPKGFVPNEEIFNQNERLYNQYKDADIAVHDEGSTASADDASGGDSEADDTGEY